MQYFLYNLENVNKAPPKYVKFFMIFMTLTARNNKRMVDIITCLYNQPHLIGTWLIGSSGSDQDFTPDSHCYDRQVASLSVITMAYQVRILITS